MTLDMVEIHSVSTRIDILDYAPKGSIKGGTMIYLKAYGHNITPSKNRINVGPVNHLNISKFFIYLTKCVYSILVLSPKKVSVET